MGRRLVCQQRICAPPPGATLSQLRWEMRLHISDFFLSKLSWPALELFVSRALELLTENIWRSLWVLTFAAWSSNLEKYILQLRQKHCEIWRNTFENFDKCIVQFGEIHLTIKTNAFCNLEKYIWNIDKYIWLTLESRPSPPSRQTGADGSGFKTDSRADSNDTQNGKPEHLSGQTLSVWKWWFPWLYLKMENLNY